MIDVASALAAYHQLHGDFPTQEQGLTELEEMGLVLDGRDSWGQPLVYLRTDEAPGWRVYSIGVDGIDDRGSGDDIDGVRSSYACRHYPEFCWDRHSVAGLSGMILFLLGMICTVLRLWQAIHTLRSTARAAA